jgi:hypothetical protein
MAKKKFGLGMAAVMFLAVGLVLAGCGASEEGDGYRIYFKVDNNTSQGITKVEFINGDTANDDVLTSHSVTLAKGDRSMEYRVWGFDIEYGSSTRRFGVKVTFEDGDTLFNWGSAGHESKVLVSVSSYYYMSFSNGNW